MGESVALDAGGTQVLSSRLLLKSFFNRYCLGLLFLDGTMSPKSRTRSVHELCAGGSCVTFTLRLCSGCTVRYVNTSGILLTSNCRAWWAIHIFLSISVNADRFCEPSEHM